MDNLELLAVAETWDNGKAIRETLNAVPLAADHFRYFAGAIRAQEGGVSQIDDDTTAFHFHEPLGVVGQIIPWNFPILMAVWKLAPALAAGNCVVLKPASLTPTSIMVLAELIGDLLPPGVLNVVTGPGSDAGKALASSPRIRKIAFTGETTTGRQIAEYKNDSFYDKALEGITLYAFNSGEVWNRRCGWPSTPRSTRPATGSQPAWWPEGVYPRPRRMSRRMRSCLATSPRWSNGIWTAAFTRSRTTLMRDYLCCVMSGPHPQSKAEIYPLDVSAREVSAAQGGQTKGPQ